ncbi:hypothetical protein [Nonomuraea basaltis]|uniref:hypothetical protein n=1 Tax=Nonomuraea basaltis TaxID=2495887 RepID=UPI00110C52E3|nr:hypothetical protein [Nonomuraea basaltis]TMR97095.1 hypothetical protein EJK15_19760 [Nonomuraea basaltis]
MTQSFGAGSAGDTVQNVVRSITEFLQQAGERQDVPQDIRDRARELQAGLTQVSGGPSMSF